MIKRKKKIIKSNFHEDNLIKERNTLREPINNRDLYFNSFRNNKNTQSTFSTSKVNNNINILKSFKKPVLLQYNVFFEGRNPGIQLENILHNNLLNIRDKFKLIVKKKDFQNKVILQLTTAVNLWKDEYKLQNKKNHNEYIITSQIIDEETKEYPTKTTKFENDICCNDKKLFRKEVKNLENDLLYKGKSFTFF